jgi:hypothetical protein
MVALGAAMSVAFMLVVVGVTMGVSSDDADFAAADASSSGQKLSLVKRAPQNAFGREPFSLSEVVANEYRPDEWNGTWEVSSGKT